MRFLSGRWFIGILIIGFGVLMLLNNLNITSISIGWLFANFWPLFLILVGLDFLFKLRGVGGFLLGLVLIGYGLLALGVNLSWLEVDLNWFWKVFWPIILILMGIQFLGGTCRNKGKSQWAILGSIKREDGPWVLHSGEFISILGDIHLDLHHANIAEGETDVYILTLLGSTKITVPRDLTVLCDGKSFIGGLDLLGRRSGGIFGALEAGQEGKAADKVVRFHCRSLIGSVKIRVY